MDIAARWMTAQWMMARLKTAREVVCGIARYTGKRWQQRFKFVINTIPHFDLAEDLQPQIRYMLVQFKCFIIKCLHHVGDGAVGKNVDVRKKMLCQH